MRTLQTRLRRLEARLGKEANSREGKNRRLGVRRRRLVLHPTTPERLLPLRALASSGELAPDIQLQFVCD